MSNANLPVAILIACLANTLTGCIGASAVATSGRPIDLRVGTDRESVIDDLGHPIESHHYDIPVAISELHEATLFHDFSSRLGYWNIARVDSISTYEVDNRRGDLSIDVPVIHQRDAFVSHGALQMNGLVAQDFEMAVPFTLGLSEIFYLDEAKVRKAGREDDGVLFLVYYDHFDQVKTAYAFNLGDIAEIKDAENSAKTVLATTFAAPTVDSD
ncbi:MAG: hypothetical protein AAGA25_05395 [Planctomycetota bacterium]